MRTFEETEIIISSNPDKLGEKLAVVVADGGSTATVEAEYGERVVYGTRFTLAHHGPRSGNLPPCLQPNVEPDRPDARLDAIGLSHVDLDTLGGVLALMGRRPGPAGFWVAAAAVDINGPHKLGTDMWLPGRIGRVSVYEKDKLRLHSFWAWSEENRFFPPRDGTVVSATSWVKMAEARLHLIFSGDPGALEEGRNHEEKGRALNEASLVQTVGPVAVRSSESFVNHLYASPDGAQYLAVVGFNPARKTITVSLADPTPGVSCREIVQSLWGPEAGGHDGIAGSPRDREMTYEDALLAAEALAEALTEDAGPAPSV